MVGDEKTGEMLTAPYDTQTGRHWAAVRLSDSALAQTAYALSPIQGFGCPALPNAVELKINASGQFGRN